jgi:hypothetical protein
MIGKCSILDKIKVLPYLTKDARSTVQQTATYYEVSEKTIKRTLQKNKDEFSEDGIEVVRGSVLKKLGVRDTDVPHKTRNLTLLPKRAVLRLGMLLIGSELAKTVRNYLLNLEEVSTTEQKEWSLQRELSKAKRRTMTDAIRDYIAESPNKHWQYKHFTDLVYRKAFGKSAKELRLEMCVKDNDQVRDNLTAGELEILEKAEVFVAGMVMAGYQYAEIKTMITNLKLSNGTTG